MPAIDRPDSSEYGAHYRKYVDLVPEGDILETLRDQIEHARALVGLKDHEALRRYEPGKWSLKQVVGHLVDTERIFAYRALRIGRGDATPLPGYDQDAFVKTGGFDERSFASLLDEFRLVRRTTVALYQSFPQEAIARTGVANENPVSVRAIAWIIAGHERHHMTIVREKYLA